ncbi:MAG: DUF1015 domain-containing protein [Ignavibacteriae bacterium]|nr:DUF1015 domain-containing protein [Ignavibacteriota bacterium]
MAVIKPLRAIRPKEDVAHLVASVPYDVVNREEAADLVNGNDINFLRVTRSEVELPESTNPYDKSVYEKARVNFEKLINDGNLIQDSEENLYVYHLTMGDQKQAGIAATFSVDDYDNDIIKKHEKTRKVKEDDRTNHIITTEAQTGAVFLTYKGVDTVNKIVDKTMQTEPIYNFTSNDGIIHKLWVMDKTDVKTVVDEIAKVDYLYIADGHHRAASAARARAVKKQNNPNDNGKEEYNFFLAVLFPAEQLKILPYNRVIYDLKGMSESDFLEKIKLNFKVKISDLPSPKNVREICLYISGKWYLLTPNENVKKANDVGGNLDVSILQNYLLQPLLGIEDIRTDTNVDFIGGIRGTQELEKLVNSGKAKIAFSMYPVSIDDLINISDAGETMPPKSTWFEPKLRDGLVVHTI